jgi:hypothetical protein
MHDRSIEIEVERSEHESECSNAHAALKRIGYGHNPGLDSDPDRDDAWPQTRLQLPWVRNRWAL